MKVKFPPPEKWAEALVKKQYPEEAARIALKEARPTYGKDENQTVNPNASYFKQAYRWIKNRYDIKGQKQSEQTA